MRILSILIIACFISVSPALAKQQGGDRHGKQVQKQAQK